MSKEVVIVGGARTAFAEYDGTSWGGQLRGFTAVELGGIASRAALDKSRVNSDLIEHVVFGMGAQYSPDSMIAGRAVGLMAGVPVEIPAFTINKICASSAQAVVSGVHMILAGEADFVLAAGAESISAAPFVVRELRGGIRINSEFKLENLVWQSLFDPYGETGTGEMADRLAKMYDISREESDQFAYESQMKAKAAQEKGRFAEEIEPIEVKGRKGQVTIVDKDDHIRPDTTLEGLGKLRPGWTKDGVVTAGNASGLVDGGAACVLATADKAREHGLDIMGRFVSWGSAGVDPKTFGTGPVPSTGIALKRANLTLDDMDIIELNEAFASQVLTVLKLWDTDVRDRLNVNGGSIAIGHPFGATGIRMINTILMELRKQDKRYGLVTMCIGGGQGFSLILESAQ